MTVKDQLMEDMKTAMKAHDAVTLQAIRFLKAEIKNTEIDEGELDDAGVVKVIMKQVKQINDSISEYEKGGRADLVETEKANLEVLKKYMPAQMSDDDISKIIDEVMTANPGAQMGIVIGQVMKRVQGQADGGRVSSLVKAKVSG